jgi:hypothetical protein
MNGHLLAGIGKDLPFESGCGRNKVTDSISAKRRCSLEDDTFVTGLIADLLYNAISQLFAGKRRKVPLRASQYSALDPPALFFNCILRAGC